MLNKILICCNMQENININIIQAGITFRNKFFHNSQTNSEVYIFEYVTSGQGHIIINNELITVTSGDMYVIPSGMSYEYFSSTDNPYERKWFYGKGKLLESLYKLYFDGKCIVKSTGDYSALFDDFFEIFNTYSVTNSYHALCLKIFDLYLTMSINENQLVKLNSESKKTVASRIKSYLISHYHEKFDLVKLSKEFVLNKNQIINVFKKAYNVTPQIFHMNLKLDMAEEMLTRNTSGKEISQYLAFCDERYFSKMFKKYKGMSPSEFKKNNINNKL